MTGLLFSERFPVEWKRARLVLIKKPGRSVEEPAAYRPICLLNAGGKLFERLLLSRLEEEIVASGGLADSQYGFRQGKSTIDAVSKVVGIIKEALSGTRRTRKIAGLILFDIRNAFNTLPWGLITEALERRRVSDYLRRILHDYLSEREIVYDSNGNVVTRVMTAGVPQGSVLGPSLWNCLRGHKP